MTVVSAMPDYHVGQIWKDRKRGGEAMFVITNVYTREYKNGETAQRVVGIISNQESDSRNTWETLPHGTAIAGIAGDDLSDLDARSVDKMFPYLVWQSYVPEDDPDDGK